MGLKLNLKLQIFDPVILDEIFNSIEHYSIQDSFLAPAGGNQER